MATQYTRIYTFTGQRNNKGRRDVAWTKFTVSGDTAHTMRQIVAVTYEHYHTSTEKPTWTLKGRLVLSDGSYIDSNTQSHKFNSDINKYTNTFSALPTAEQFAKITAVQTIANDTAEPTSTGGGDLYWRATAAEPMKVIVTFLEEPPTHYGPGVDTFELTRVDANGAASNEGVYLRMDVKLSLLDASNKANSTVRIYYSTENNIDTETSPYFVPNLTIDQMLAGIYGNTQAVPLTFSNGSKWYFALVFSCGGETAVDSVTIGRAFAALHISPCSTGGVAVGGFSTSAEGNPKFEAYPPAYFYGGIAQIGDGGKNAQQQLGIQSGSVAGSEINSGVVAEYSVVFEKPYNAAPFVVIGDMISGTDSELKSYYAGRVGCKLISVSATGFKAAAYNFVGNTYKINLGFNWAAFGTLA